MLRRVAYTGAAAFAAVAGASVLAYYASSPRVRFRATEIPRQQRVDPAYVGPAVAVVTGGNTGLGFETVRELVRHGAHVVMACRSEEKARAAIAALDAELAGVEGHGKVEFMHLDLASLASVRAFTDAFKARGTPLHVLVNNAGVFASRHGVTADGFETMMGVHHVGHVLLTLDLLPVLEASAPARVVILTSRAHGMSKGLSLTRGGDGKLALAVGSAATFSSYPYYANSKLANIYFGHWLAEREKDTGVFVNLAHPGYCETTMVTGSQADMGPVLGRLLNAVARVVAYSPAEGALTPLFLATSPSVVAENIRGKYFVPIADPATPSTAAEDGAKRAEVMEWTLQELRDRGYLGHDSPGGRSVA